MLTPELEADLRIRAGEFTAAHPNAPDPAEESVDSLWTRVLAAVPETWTTEALERHFETITGVDADKATAADMRAYLSHLPTGA